MLYLQTLNKYWVNLRQAVGETTKDGGWYWALPGGSTISCTWHCEFGLLKNKTWEFSVDTSATAWDIGNSQPNDGRDGEDGDQQYACLESGGLNDVPEHWSKCRPLCQFALGNIQLCTNDKFPRVLRAGPSATTTTELATTDETTGAPTGAPTTPNPTSLWLALLA